MSKLPIVARTAYGRLGNQIFQYAALRQISGTLYLDGFSPLFRTFSNVRAKKLPRGLSRALQSAADPRGRLSRRLHWFINFVDEEWSSGELKFEPDKLLYICRREVYSQCANSANVRHGLALDFKEEVLEGARAFLVRAAIDVENFIVVHIRGTDYAKFPSQAAPAQLPLEWVHRQMDSLRDLHANADIVILGDDAALKNEFAWRSGGTVSTEDEAVDLALLSLARGGVLSASSFAWWGAAFAAHQGRRPVTFVAPEFWFGIRLGRWEPPSLQFSPHLSFKPFR